MTRYFRIESSSSILGKRTTIYYAGRKKRGRPLRNKKKKIRTDWNLWNVKSSINLPFEEKGDLSKL